MEPRHFVLTPDQHAPALTVVGTEVAILAANAATQSYGITLQRGDEGTGPPMHRHDWDEAFYVLDAEIEFLCAGETHRCTPGTLVHVPRGTAHAFRYAKGGGRMLEITGQGALAAQMFATLDREIPPGPPDVAKTIEVLGRSGVILSA